MSMQQETHLPAWCETRGEPGIDGRYTVACYYTIAGHPVTRERAERVEIIEYAPDGTRLRVDVGLIERTPFAKSTPPAHPRPATLRRRATQAS